MPCSLPVLQLCMMHIFMKLHVKKKGTNTCSFPENSNEEEMYWCNDDGSVAVGRYMYTCNYVTIILWKTTKCDRVFLFLFFFFSQWFLS